MVAVRLVVLEHAGAAPWRAGVDTWRAVGLHLGIGEMSDQDAAPMGGSTRTGRPPCWLGTSPGAVLDPGGKGFVMEAEA